MGTKRKSLTEISECGQENKKSRRQTEDSDEESDTSIQSNDEHGRAGRVLKVYLKNFMCHTSLEINLNKNVNYLIGRNGSGKSAILTALIVGLGGKANMTSRGNSMKSFVKVGQAQSTVEITISNDGPMAYKPKTYGEQITIIRTFGENVSRYKIKNEKGESVSAAFREVRKITEALNIQVDNPICILNQDVARTFLNTNDTSKRYQMFLKATNLENINDQHHKALQNKLETVTVFNKRKGELKNLHKELEKWLKKVQVLDSIGTLEVQKKELQTEVLWSKVFEVESELTEKEEDRNKCQKEVDELQNTTESKANRKKTLLETKETLSNQLREIKQEEESNQVNINSVKTRLQKFNDQVFTKQKTVDNLKQQIKRLKRDRDNIDNELNSAQSSQPNRQEILKQRAVQIDNLKKKSVTIIDLLSTTENDLIQNRNVLENKVVDLRNIKEEISHLDGKISQRKLQIRSLKSSEDTSLTVYGRLMPQLLNAINAAKEQFLEMPKGPIGAYITLKDKKWALAVEEFIGFGMLQTFCVSNSRDSRILNKIFQNVFVKHPKPSIICSKFFHKVHDISPNKTAVPADCVALIDALKISDPVIMNCLIDQLNVEGILLTPTSDLAMKLMSQAYNVPENCTRALTIKGDIFYPDPNYRSYSARQKVSKYLQVNTTDLIKQYENEIENYVHNNKSIKSQCQNLGSDIIKLEKTINDLESKISNLTRAKLKFQDKINEINMEELPAEKNFEILKDELTEIDKHIGNKKFEIDGINKEIESIDVNAKEVKTEINNLKQLTTELNERLLPIVNQLDETNAKLKTIDTEAKFKADRLKNKKDSLQTIVKQHKKCKIEYDQLLKEATDLGTKPTNKRTTAEVLEDLETVKESLAEITTLTCDADTIRHMYKKYNKRHNEVKKLVDSVHNTLSEITMSLHSRSRQYHRLTKQIEVRVTEMFTNIMALRKFKGTLTINSENKTLDLNVIPQHGQQDAVHKHILSGGERSYSTVAFLMSLWQVMEYPFYFLDEFDVFMDKVNRRTVMDMLLEHGLDHRHLQFVFLTPQDISTVHPGENVTIHRMADPERNNALTQS